MISIASAYLGKLSDETRTSPLQFGTDWNAKGPLLFVNDAVALMLDKVRAYSLNKKDGQELPYTVRFIQRLGWRVFAICAHSQAFRLACTHEERKVQSLLMEMIEENRYSLRAYAYLRKLEWRGPLLTHSQQALPELRRGLGAEPRPSGSVPTELVLTQDGRLHRPHYNGHVRCI